MSSCFIKRVVAFALAFLCGVAVWQLIGVKLQVLNDVLHLEYETPTARGERGTWAYARPEGEEGRTWLVVRTPPAVASPRSKAPECDSCSVRMRVLFGGDGVAVPGNGFSLSPAAYPLIEDAVAAARSINFKPATKNGRPIPLWANVTYMCVEELKPHSRGEYTCGLWVEQGSARTWDGRPWRLITTNE